MATLTSEAEFERLYQEFVRRNGGLPTLVADQYNTPAEFYKATTEVTLSPSELAALQARQEQYNRATALNTISNEIKSNNFINPYDARSQAAIANLNSITAIPIKLEDGTETTSYAQLGELNRSLAPLSDPAIGGSPALAAIVYSGVAASTGLDLGKLLLGAGLVTAGVAMFSDLKSHTDSQTENLPEKMNEIEQLAGMQQAFGEMSNDSCSLWNALMGIMSGAFDGVLDFIEGGIEKFKDFMSSTSIGQIFNQIKGAIDSVIGGITSKINEIMGPINGVIDQITGQIQGMIDNIVGSITAAIQPVLDAAKAAFDSAMSAIDGALGGVMDAMGKLGDLANNLLGAVGDMVDQIAGEISGLIDMAAGIADKLKSLAMAAMMLDPCKLAVLLNAGSPALAGAAQQITNPVESAVPNVNVPTTTDDRANPEEVTAAVESARRDAAASPGVPQNPFGALATLYQPFNAYLHDLFTSVEGIFGGTFEAVKSSDVGSVINKIGETMGNNPVMSSLGSITNGLQGTIGDISGQLSSMAGGLGGNMDQALGGLTGGLSGITSGITSSLNIGSITDNITGSLSGITSQFSGVASNLAGSLNTTGSLGSIQNADFSFGGAANVSNFTAPTTSASSAPSVAGSDQPSGWTTMTIGGVTYEVGNDYVREGRTYKTFSGASAAAYARSKGWIMPTTAMVNAIAARARIITMPTQAQWDPNSRFYPNGDAAYHTQQIFELTGGRFPSGLVAGHKKDVVAGPANKTCLAGGAKADGGFWQNGSCPHDQNHQDYSQGLRPIRLPRR